MNVTVLAAYINGLPDQRNQVITMQRLVGRLRVAFASVG